MSFENVDRPSFSKISQSLQSILNEDSNDTNLGFYKQNQNKNRKFYQI